MRLRPTALVLAAASSLLACTGLNKFQAGRRIEAEPRALGHEYKQEGKPIEVVHELTVFFELVYR